MDITNLSSEVRVVTQLHLAYRIKSAVKLKWRWERTTAELR
jgi:hypothetical protein